MKKNCFFTLTSNKFLIMCEESINELLTMRKFIAGYIDVWNYSKTINKYKWVKDVISKNVGRDYERELN